MSADPWLTVLMRAVPPSMADCELTCIDREPIDVHRVRSQHESYAEAVQQSSSATNTNTPPATTKLVSLPVLDSYQDCMFVEDVAIVFDECAVLTNPGAASRRGEVEAMVEPLSALRPPNRLYRVQAPGTIEGGDTLVVGKFVFVGDSTRTNKSGFEQLQSFVAPFGYQCFHIPIEKCLHLKSAASKLDDQTVLFNPDWIEAAVFHRVGLKTVAIDHVDEPHAANVLTYTVAPNKRVIVTANAYPKTQQIVAHWAANDKKDETAKRGEEVSIVKLDVDEIAKAEGALTCCSLLCYGFKE